MYRLAAVIGAAFLVLIPQTLSAQDLTTARKLLAEGEEAKARKTLEEIISAGKKDSSLAAYLLGHLYYQAREFDRAAEAFSRVSGVAIEPYARFYQAESLFWDHDALSARKVFSTIAEDKNSPFHLWALLRLADADFALGDYAKAQKEYRAFLKEYPSYPYPEAILFALAECAARTGNPQGAASAYLSLWVNYPHTIYAQRALDARKALAKAGEEISEPSFLERLERARILREQRVHAQALKELDALRKEVAAQSFSGDAALIVAIDLERGKTLLRLGKAEEVVSILSPIVSSSDQAKKFLAEAQALSGDPESAAKTFADYLKIKGSAKGQQIRPYADFLFYYGLYKEARAEYQKLRKDSLVSFRIAWCAYRAGMYKEAASELKALAKRYPEHRELAAYWLARIDEKNGKQEDAVAAYRAAVKENDTAYYSILARSRLYALGLPVSEEKEKSQEEPKALVKEDPQDPWSYIESRRPKDSDVVAAFEKMLEHKDSLALRRAYEFYRIGLYENGREELADIYAELRYGTGATFQSRSPYFPANWKRASNAIKLFSTVDAIKSGEVSESLAPTKKDTSTLQKKRSQGRSRKTIVSPRAIPQEFGKYLGIAFGGLGDAHYPMYLNPVSGAKRYYPQAYPEEVIPVAQELGHMPEEIWALMHTESLFHRFVASHVGAIGLLQIMPKTGRAIAALLGYDDFRPGTLFDARTNIYFGAWYYQQLKKVFQGQLPLAMAAYNGGPYMIGRIVRGKAWTNPDIDEIVEEIPATESRRYAKKVLSKVALYQKLYQGSTDLAINLTLNTTVGDEVDF